jgi:2-isopropylmalate synthase
MSQHTHDATAHVDATALGLPPSVEVYDTTLRDGSQQEGISLTIDDKLRVAEQLDHLGVAFIEGGYPGANPKDAEFFQRASRELHLKSASLVAFGSTRRAGARVQDDPLVAEILRADTDAVCIVGKASELHVTETLRTSLEEAVAMVYDTVAYLSTEGRRVFFDAEHFFDGYFEASEFSRRVLDAAERGGAVGLVLCDTNGGMLPSQVAEVLGTIRQQTSAVLGVHFHNDSGCAIANTLAGVYEGATQIQGCVNGYGERAGNADLCAAIANLTLKLGVETIPRERIALITPVSRHVAEIVNLTVDPQRPYVGKSAFTHKAGLHTSAIARRRDAYEHVDPDAVGNGTRVVVSELAGRSTLAMKALELGITLDSESVSSVLETLKGLERDGYHFEVADGSLELLMRAAADGVKSLQQYFEVESLSVVTNWVESRDTEEERIVHPWDRDGDLTTEATIKVRVHGNVVDATAKGNGPVHALDAALRSAIGSYFPELALLHLTDYRVRVLNTAEGTAAVTRVLIDLADQEGQFSTIGVSENIIESSWQALVDGIVFGLVRAERQRAQMGLRPRTTNLRP